MKLKFWKRNKLPQSPIPLQYAFTVDGQPYYEPKIDTGGLNNLPWARAMMLHHFYDELNMKVDKNYLTKHVAAMKALLGEDGKPKRTFTTKDLSEISRLNSFLEERVNWIFTPDLVYKVASVVFVTADEDITKYDHALNDKKIASWKKHGLGAFFLNEPVQRLIPFLNISPIDIQAYGEQIQMLDTAMLDLLKSLSTDGLQTSSMN